MGAGSPETFSEPSSNEMVNDQNPVSPTEDYRLFSEEIICIARALEIEVAKTDTKAPSANSFPSLKELDEMTIPIWKIPVPAPTTARKVEHLWWVKIDKAEYLVAHLPHLI